jgi:mannose-6-phosphate isomerase
VLLAWYQPSLRSCVDVLRGAASLAIFADISPCALDRYWSRITNSRKKKVRGTTMDLTKVAPFLVEPRFVGKVWGYDDLRPWYDHIAGSEPIGEVWLTGDDCLVANGPHAGKKLSALFSEASVALLGSHSPSNESPLLIKTIFAREKLSVQVHPDDRMAQKYGDPRGKTECWYVLSAQPDAKLALGLKPGVTIDQVRTGMKDGSLENSLNVLSVDAGDMVFVDAGTVHAIWPGSILLETQQNCDLTYRMFDYGRARPLHIEKSLEATRLKTRAGKVPPQPLDDRTVLLDVEYFCVERIPIAVHRAAVTLPGKGEPVPGLSYLFAVNGSAKISGPGFDAFELPTRGIAAIPATAGDFIVENLGDLDLLRISPRWPVAAA